MKEITPVIVEDAALFSGFAQRVKMAYWKIEPAERVKEKYLDQILLLAWEDFNLQKKPDKRNPEIQALWEYGLQIGFTDTKQNLQRFASNAFSSNTTIRNFALPPNTPHTLCATFLTTLI